MRFPLVCSALLLGGAILHAQQPILRFTSPQAQQSQESVIQIPGSCPVGLSARRSPAGTVIVTGDTRHPAKPVPQALLLRVIGSIAEIKLTAFGPPAGAHLMPVRSDAGAEQMQSFTLSGDMRNNDGEFRLIASRISSVQRVVVTEIRFADGSTWMPSNTQSCVAVPSGFMLVGQQR